MSALGGVARTASVRFMTQNTHRQGYQHNRFPVIHVQIKLSHHVFILLEAWVIQIAKYIEFHSCCRNQQEKLESEQER